MAAPNVVNVSTITGKTNFQSVTTATTAIVANAAGSGKVIKINTLFLTNVNGTSVAEITATIYNADNTTSYSLLSTVTIPADAVLDAINKSIYLEEGDELRLVSATDNDIHATCSFEEIS